MKIFGEYGTSGEYIEYQKPIEVVQFGDTLRDDDGMVWAVKDEYGDWVSPTMKQLGLKCKIKTGV